MLALKFVCCYPQFRFIQLLCSIFLKILRERLPWGTPYLRSDIGDILYSRGSNITPF